MRILFCCQFYAPSVGGVQELIRQLAERLAAKGHQVTVATTSLPNRDFLSLNGVEIKAFSVTGNWVSGMHGELDEYRDYVKNGPFDVMLVYAAQQWTFDALWPILDDISFVKVFFPSGFSGLYEPGYTRYFQEMPDVLMRFDHLVFNTNKYRDVDFARQHGIENYSVMPNGASEDIFNVPMDSSFKAHHGIPAHSFLFLTVGTFTGLKGHLELVKAFKKLKLPAGRHATLILNGNEVQVLDASIGGLVGKLLGLIKTHGLAYVLRQIWKRMPGAGESPKKIAAAINSTEPDKHVLITDFPRAELTQAFMAADLFVFASNIEYSPLVLYESAAAGTPFLTVDVGNSREIVQWTGAGVMCPSWVDSKGYTRVDEAVLANAMAELMEQPQRLAELGETGRNNWVERLTWGKIAARYEEIFNNLINAKKQANPV